MLASHEDSGVWLEVREDHYTFLGNCQPTPPLSQHVALSEKQVLT